MYKDKVQKKQFAYFINEVEQHFFFEIKNKNTPLNFNLMFALRLVRLFAQICSLAMQKKIAYALIRCDLLSFVSHNLLEQNQLGRHLYAESVIHFDTLSLRSLVSHVFTTWFK